MMDRRLTTGEAVVLRLLGLPLRTAGAIYSFNATHHIMRADNGGTYCGQRRDHRQDTLPDTKRSVCLVCIMNWKEDND